jgi:hypothetical protein
VTASGTTPARGMSLNSVRASSPQSGVELLAVLSAAAAAAAVVVDVEVQACTTQNDMMVHKSLRTSCEGSV